MPLEKHHGGWVILVTFIVAFMLAMMPLPDSIVLWRPDWIAMVLIYWCIATPQRVGIASAWVIGIFEDVLSDTLLGQHALSLCIVAYLSAKLHRQIRLFPQWQQSIGVLVLVLINQLPMIWVQGMLNRPSIGWAFVYPAITSMVMWHWSYSVLRKLRQTYQVY